MSKTLKGGSIAVYLPGDVYAAYAELPPEKRRDITSRLREIARFMIVNGNAAVIACNDLKTLTPSLNKLLGQILSAYTVANYQNRNTRLDPATRRNLEEILDIAKTYLSLYALLLKQCSYEDYVILKHSLETKYNIRLSV